ncbi:hypothetical protein ACHAXR_008897 [Thalassiosira sp. AJA248-18]
MAAALRYLLLSTVVITFAVALDHHADPSTSSSVKMDEAHHGFDSFDALLLNTARHLKKKEQHHKRFDTEDGGNDGQDMNNNANATNANKRHKKKHMNNKRKKMNKIKKMKKMKKEEQKEQKRPKSIKSTSLSYDVPPSSKSGKSTASFSTSLSYDLKKKPAPKAGKKSTTKMISKAPSSSAAHPAHKRTKAGKSSIVSTHMPTKSPTPVSSPQINPDHYNRVIGRTFLDVLENDIVAPDSGDLKIVEILTSPNNNARNLQDGDIAMVRPGEPSQQGGMCEPTGNRERIRYTPPDTDPAFEGMDQCEYRACDDNDACGTALVTMNVIMPGSPTDAPSSSPTNKSTPSSKAGKSTSSKAEKPTNMETKSRKSSSDSSHSEAPTNSPVPTNSPTPCQHQDNTDKFEEGIFPIAHWSTGGDDVWDITDDKARSGMYSIKSPNLEVGRPLQPPSRSNATLTICDDFKGGLMRFETIASVLPPHDILRIYIDGALYEQMAEVNDWTTMSFGLNPGSHVIDFSYQFNFFGLEVMPDRAAGIEGYAWIDNVMVQTLNGEA